MGNIRENGRYLLLFLSLLLAGIPQAMAQPRDLDSLFRDAPKVQSALKLGKSAEKKGNLQEAVAQYCVVASTGNPEGYFRIGHLLAKGRASVRNPKLANTYLSMAMRLGSQQAKTYFNEKIGIAPMGDQCGEGINSALPQLASTGGGSSNYVVELSKYPFNVDAWLARQTPAKQKMAAMLRAAAKRHNVDPRLVLAIAITESSLNSDAVSPMNAQGVMQLIPETQERFGVTSPFDPAQNIRGGVSYLKWLNARFNGNWKHISAAYNAGENAVTRYGGIPPYQETQNYVKRVLYYAGCSINSDTAC
ncbi:MAG: lytic transglycosylase domain-containing protein [Aeromonas sp.]